MAYRIVLHFLRLRAFRLVCVLAVVTVCSSAAVGAEPVTASDQALYVSAGDGTRLAIDVFLPGGGVSRQRVPTILRMTRYHRLSIPSRYPDGVPPEASAFNTAGYALVLVDARGTGASFGSRQAELFARQDEDFRDVMRWVVQQPWSNGRVGTWGISFDGTVAESVASQETSGALRAVAPLFNVFRPYQVIFDPGGILNRHFVVGWLMTGQMLDGFPVDPCAVATYFVLPCDLLKLFFGAAKPVDGPDGAQLLQQAQAEHRAGSRDLTPLAMSVAYEDEARFGETVDGGSPSTLRKQIEAHRVPELVRASWLDSALALGTLERFMTWNVPQDVWIGPWPHGGVTNDDPFPDVLRPIPTPAEATLQLLVNFFDAHLKSDAPLTPSKLLHYYTLGEGVWRTTPMWPPSGTANRRLWLSPGHRLAVARPPGVPAEDAYPVNYTAGTGTHSRWDTSLGGFDVSYPDRHTEDDKLLVYTSDQLRQPVRITGSPGLNVCLRSSASDGALFAYLEDVDADGRVTYITEGQLRLRDRKIATLDALAALRVHRTFARRDAQPLVPGRQTCVRFDLLPTSALFAAGHRIRLALAGADKDHFARYPARGTPVIHVDLGGVHASTLDLPIAGP